MHKVVIRLMADGGQMLGWAEAQGHARGDGKIWVESDVLVAIIEDGYWDYISAHWADVNIEVRNRVPEGPIELIKGSVIPIKAPWPVFSLGEPAGGLPPVVVTSNVKITVPTGSMNPIGR